MRIEDEDGAWEGHVTGAGAPARAFDVQVILVGEDAYEGLFAVLYMDGGPTGMFELNGTILVGSPPPSG